MHTASASGLTPFSIRETHMDRVLRSKPVFCILTGQRRRGESCKKRSLHTRSNDISSKTSITSRAARRFSSISVLGIFACPHCIVVKRFVHSKHGRFDIWWGLNAAALGQDGKRRGFRSCFIIFPKNDDNLLLNLSQFDNRLISITT